MGVDPPRGIYPARVDEKGRLKLPVDFQHFLIASGGVKVFITSLDLTTARIYPISIWRDNEKIFETLTDDPEGAADVAFLANDLGADSELDGQGRLLVPAELRKELNLESQPVWLECYQGAITIYTKEVYDERRRRSRENLTDKVTALKKKGLR